MGNTSAYVLLVNGPNLNRLGVREPATYGTETLEDIHQRLQRMAEPHGVDVRSFQSNHEGAIVDYLQTHGPGSIGIILNPGALAHYGYALRDCLADIQVPTVEVHISNVHKREAFRHTLVMADVVTGQVVGLGTKGYDLALGYFISPAQK